MIADELADARNIVRRELATYGEPAVAAPDGFSYNEDQVLGDWLPE